MPNLADTLKLMRRQVAQCAADLGFECREMQLIGPFQVRLATWPPVGLVIVADERCATTEELQETHETCETHENDAST